MAALRLGSLCRALTRPSNLALVQRGLAISAVDMKKVIPLPDPLEHAVGIEKIEKLAKLQGIDDPFDLKLRKRGEGSKENPDLVPSIFNKRIIGHICEEDQTHITWFYLYKGHPKRCQCGHWFKLVEAQPL